MENIEIKARLNDPSAVRDQVQQLAHSFLGLDHQIDTYFKTKNGRMKLRESKLSGDYLILYQRSDQAGPRSSVYEIIPVKRSAEVKMILGNLLGLDLVVEKVRNIYLYENVRIHLDKVENLGNFLEFEAVMDNNHQDHEQETEKINRLMAILKISAADLVPKSYQDLIREKAAT